MKVPSKLTNDQLESLYEKIDDDVINLPQQFQRLRLGLLSRICQLFITALKSNPKKVVKFFQFDSANEDAITKLLEDPHCLTALLMSDKVYDKGECEFKSKVNINIQKRLNKSIYKSGHRVQLFAVDHSIKKYAFPSCFYLPEGSSSLKQSGFYNNLLERVVSIIPPSSSISKEQVIDLGQAVYELIENTEQHGKLEFDIGNVHKSVRGLVIDYNLINKDQKSESIGGENTAITDYLESIRTKERTVHLLEISIFDSGRGIVESLGASGELYFNVGEQVKVVEQSFAKGETSKANPQGYGRGLFNVRNVLNKRKGFMSIRTGNVGVYRDFNLQPLTEDDKSPLLLFDEIKKSNSIYSEMAHVEGLAYSILVPLK